MKLRKTAALGLLTIGSAYTAFADEKSENLNKFNDFDVRLLEATDARDAQNPVFGEAIKSGKWAALTYLGQIGGEACARITPFLTHENAEAREAAALGVAACNDASLGQALVDAEEEDNSVSRLIAMGFSGGDMGRQYLVETVNAIEAGTGVGHCAVMEPREVALFALMQAIVYDRLDPSALPDLDVAHLLELTADPCVGYKAAYLLGRLQKLDQILSLEEVTHAVDTAPAPDVSRALVRVLRQFGNASSLTLQALAGGENNEIAMEAVRAMGSLSDEGSKNYLIALVAGEDTFMRHLALAALAGRDAMDAGVSQLIAASVEDPNPWVAVTALQSLNVRTPEEVLPVARRWFEGDDYYKAFSAMSLLSQSDEGKAILEAYAGANPNTIRGREAAIALDPSIEGIEKPRKTPGWNMVRSYQERELKLQTTRGDVCIKPSSLAPYAAANFMLLADVGKMNGMLWHRVIPNFVAQAGQSEDPELASWGTIREEWWGSIHVPGTVGVATAGRDTGSTQFFINTAYNMHLNGRYTVMGHVTEGMDVAHKLQEGDVIEKAETVRAGMCK
ncbi:MAG: peptidylprolyl isomerase [Alphaproteobacteria bacterium]|nr:peptidylprolyl isomerase [Alphaproteobacteria bacterium]